MIAQTGTKLNAQAECTRCHRRNVLANIRPLALYNTGGTSRSVLSIGLAKVKVKPPDGSCYNSEKDARANGSVQRNYH